MKNLLQTLALILFVFSFSNCKTSQSFAEKTKNFPKSIEDAQMRADFQDLREYIFVASFGVENGKEFSESLPTEIKGVVGEVTICYKIGNIGSTKVIFETPTQLYCVHLSLGEGGRDFVIWAQKFEFVWEQIPAADPDNSDPLIARSKKLSSWETGEISPNQIVAQARKLFIDH